MPYGNALDESIPLKLISYVDFKEWLEWNYPYFKDAEIETDRWQVKYKDHVISVRLGTYDKYDDNGIPNYDQFVSVSVEKKDRTSGWSCPCDTFEELREKLNEVYKIYLSLDSPPFEMEEQIALF